MRTKFFLVTSLAWFALLATALTGCTAEQDTPPDRELDFLDNGISFSVSLWDDKALLRPEGQGTYLYSTDYGRSYNKLRDGVTLSLSGSDSFSVCLMEKDSPETVTDLYTISASSDLTAVSSAEKILGDGTITLFPDGAGNYEASIDNETWKTSHSGEVTFDDLAEGMYTVQVRDGDNVTALRVPVPHAETGRRAVLNTEPLLQYPELPTGCEVTSLTMLLRYLGLDADKLEISDNYLPKGGYRKSDYHAVFVGNPRDRAAYGCTAAVIAETAERYLADYAPEGGYEVLDVTGCTPEILYSAVDNGYPAVVWASINMEEIIPDYVSWTDEESGETVSWPGGEHCLLLTGYDKDAGVVYVNDPLKGSTEYEMKLFEKRFKEMENNAILILKEK